MLKENNIKKVDDRAFHQIKLSEKNSYYFDGSYKEKFYFIVTAKTKKSLFKRRKLRNNYLLGEN